MQNENQDPENRREPAGDIGFFSVLGSVFRAWFGVQKEAHRQRDFASNNPLPFIVAGIVFVVIMIMGVLIVVNLALP